MTKLMKNQKEFKKYVERHAKLVNNINLMTIKLCGRDAYTLILGEVNPEDEHEVRHIAPVGCFMKPASDEKFLIESSVVDEEYYSNDFKKSLKMIASELHERLTDAHFYLKHMDYRDFNYLVKKPKKSSYIFGDLDLLTLQDVFFGGLTYRDFVKTENQPIDKVNSLFTKDNLFD